MNRQLRTTAISALVLTLPLTTASSVLASPAPLTESLDSHGTADSNEAISAGLSAEAHTVERNESGNLLSVTWSIENEGDAPTTFSWPSGTSYMYDDPSSFSGVTITSTDERRRFHPLMDSEGDCLCSGNVSLDFKATIDPGEKVAYWSMYSVPVDVDEIDLEIPGFDAIEGIPVS
ncbi:hypothetical protein [Nocardiopsis sp. NPDC058789]|uniref:hypothetical protein n=1 Tax=Nocardiopsis TaxID=2013 RepID=UPI00366F8281